MAVSYAAALYTKSTYHIHHVNHFTVGQAGSFVKVAKFQEKTALIKMNTLL